MAEQTVLIFTEDFEDLEELEDAEAGILLKAIMQYLTEGSVYDRLEGDAKVMFRYIRRRIDREKAKYAETCKRRAEAGKKGGRPKNTLVFDDKSEGEKPLATFGYSEKAKKANGFSEKQTKAKKPDNEYENENEYEYEYQNDNENENEPLPAMSAGDGLYADDREKRIAFLKKMIRIFGNDDAAVEEYRQELVQLTGGG